ncbi:hypothetical protein LHYA1_G002995 [Lachnellula hyalina]|uniref:Uncharacterized protein n=1 Tax=Lachnellula hyalina TaxID=1316788 RepID=A0A8H8R4A0_9HELO|nr:uncharacterized protein LHYA1_G002995 [Lachnellula hyalina]TVY27381.1 hypothetical protein LHYA1_G002995 [Lachnellula hyalina]
MSSFYLSWQLWEKMTFVLGLAILTVFCIGWGKVLWRNRLVQRQEIVDEERRIRIQELRTSGQLIELQGGHDVPFGIKAIESGIEVEGIWIPSRKNSPVRSELKLGHVHGESDTLAALDMKISGQTSAEAFPTPTRPTPRGRSSLGTTSTATVPLERSPVSGDITASERSEFDRNKALYKPRKSSHLRYGSYGETRFDVATLSQLEGHCSVENIPHSHRSRASRQLEPEAYSSAADNEHSSGVSSDSEATLSCHILSQEDRKRQSVPEEQSTRTIDTSVPADVPSHKSIQSSVPIQCSKADYFSIPQFSPDYESMEPLATPQQVATEFSPFMPSTIPGTWPSAQLEGDSQLLRRSQNIPLLPFVPRELHMNKTLRKVNSGFQVLPAGTFGTHDPTIDERSILYDGGEDTRRQSKLQKKPPASIISGRLSRTSERP